MIASTGLPVRRTVAIVADANVSDRFLIALADLALVADELTAEATMALIDGGALEVFWRDWPEVSDCAGALWRQLDDDLAGPATPAVEGDLDETGDGD